MLCRDEVFFDSALNYFPQNTQLLTATSSDTKQASSSQTCTDARHRIGWTRIQQKLENTHPHSFFCLQSETVKLVNTSSVLLVTRQPAQRLRGIRPGPWPRRRKAADMRVRTFKTAPSLEASSHELELIEANQDPYIVLMGS